MRRLLLAAALVAGGAALYRRAQEIAEQEDRPLVDVISELPGRLWRDLGTIPDDLRAAAEEGRSAAQRAAADVGTE